MNKHYLILTAVTVLALAAMGCGFQFATSTPTPAPQQLMPGPQNINPGPQGPDNGNPGPQGPDPMNPVPQGPGPDPLNQGPIPNGGGPGGNPGGGQILSFTADRTTLNKGDCAMLHWETQGGFGANLDGQPVQPMGQQQVCPTQTTLYGLGLDTGGQMLRREVTITVNGGGQNPNLIVPTPTKPKSNNSGGNKPVITDTPSSPFANIPLLKAEVVNLDLAISNIYPSSTGHIMVTLKNTGNIKISGSYKIVCSGSYIDNGGNNALKLAGQYAAVDLTPGKTADFDTSYSRNPTIQKMYVQCTLTPPQGDTNKGNNSMGPTQVK